MVRPDPTTTTYSSSFAMEKLIEVEEQEILIDFQLGVKCRADVHLRSLHPTLPVAFKVQTSSPHKFLVNPPNGILPPLSSSSFQVILKPQAQLPHPFPRSPSDRFLIKSALSPPDLPGHASSINHLFSSTPNLPTHDTKLKVVYVGSFLLQHATNAGDADAVKQLLRRQPAAAKGEGGGSVAPVARAGWSAVHAAAAAGRYEELVEVLEGGGGEAVEVDGRDGEGRTALHLATSKGYMRCVRALVERGADRNARSRDGRTALHRAAANGDCEMVALLLEVGADPSLANGKGRTALDVARDKGHKEVVEVLERGEMVLTAARRGDLNRLESLLKKGIGTNSQDQYGITALHSAAIKGHRDIVSLLVEFGMDIECQDVEGHTPLHLGVEGGWLEIVQLLIEMGANVNAKSKRGATPLYMAKSMGYEDISQLLVSKGASGTSVASSSSSLSSTSYG